MVAIGPNLTTAAGCARGRCWAPPSRCPSPKSIGGTSRRASPIGACTGSTWSSRLPTATVDARRTDVAWQRCQLHLTRAALVFLPRTEMQAEVMASWRAVFALLRSHRSRLRASNMRKRCNAGWRRRTRMAGLSPDDASLLRLVGAIVMEGDEGWRTNPKF